MDQKNVHLMNYLQQQSGIESSPEAVPTDNISLDEFKEYVKRYMEIDNWLKKAQDVMKEKKKQKAELSDIITQFMVKYDIDDLNSKFGKISCKVRKTKEPISQGKIREKITNYFKDKPNVSEELIQTVFDNRQVVERPSLRRIKIS